MAPSRSRQATAGPLTALSCGMTEFTCDLPRSAQARADSLKVKLAPSATLCLWLTWHVLLRVFHLLALSSQKRTLRGKRLRTIWTDCLTSRSLSQTQPRKLRKVPLRPLTQTRFTPSALKRCKSQASMAPFVSNVQVSTPAPARLPAVHRAHHKQACTDRRCGAHSVNTPVARSELFSRTLTGSRFYKSTMVATARPGCSGPHTPIHQGLTCSVHAKLCSPPWLPQCIVLVPIAS